MKSIVWAFVAAALLAGGARAQQPAPPTAPGASASSIEPAPPGADTCRATALAGLIGQSRSAIPIPVDPSRRRVVCSTCPRTMDYRPDRLTVFFDQRTGRVTTLQCG